MMMPAIEGRMLDMNLCFFVLNPNYHQQSIINEMTLAQSLPRILLVTDRLPPPGVVEIPLNGLADAGLESFLRRPAQLAAQLGGVDGVASIVAGAVGDKGD